MRRFQPPETLLDSSHNRLQAPGSNRELNQDFSLCLAPCACCLLPVFRIPDSPLDVVPVDAGTDSLRVHVDGGRSCGRPPSNSRQRSPGNPRTVDRAPASGPGSSRRGISRNPVRRVRGSVKPRGGHFQGYRAPGQIVHVEQIAHLVADGRAVLEGGTALAVDEDPNEPPGLHPEALEFHEFQAFGLDQAVRSVR